MKTTGLLSLAAALVSGVAAGSHNGHRHEHLHEARDTPAVLSSSVYTDATSCGCTTIWTTFYGLPTLVPASSVPSSVPSSVAVPTNQATVFQTPGVYTIPATTITVQQTTTVCNAASTNVPSGTYTVGGVTTIVSTATTVVCPYATTSTVGGVVTSIIATTQYVCPSAGTYTIAPVITTVTASGVIVYPVAATFTPGTYTRAQAVVTVTNTAYAYVCPFSNAPIAAPTSSPQQQPAAQKAPEQQKSSPKVSAPAGKLGSSTDVWAITYTQYTKTGDCKDADTIMREVGGLPAKGFSSLRMYGTDCNGLDYIGKAVRAANMKMIIGIFIDSAGVPKAQKQVSDIIAWAQWDIVELIVCGNEAVLGGLITITDLVTFVVNCKSSFSAAGYTGLVSTAETVNIWQQYANVLCDVVDVVTFNSHAFFDPGTAAAQAGTFIQSQFAIMNAICPGKPESYNTECGWPTAGSCNGQACPGVAEQATAMSAIRSAAGGRVVVFAYQDELWKPARDQHWGIMGCYN